jgi:glycerate kinase
MPRGYPAAPYAGVTRGRGGTGRRAGFRSRSPFGGGGSSPLVRTIVPHLLAAFDKFRGTATAAEVSAAAARAARACAWSADELPLADGGEGTLDALERVEPGERRIAVVRGPMGQSVAADWLFFPDGFPDTGPGPGVPDFGGRPAALRFDSHPMAVVESAGAVGRALLPAPQGDDPVEARTDGVGDLILAAADAGAVLVVVAVGGSATTDGGFGAVSVIGSTARLGGARLVVACDVSTPFRLAAETFGPQKGATRAQVGTLRRRLDGLAERYRAEFGVDVDHLAGSGAAGGLAGGLAALGARLVPGFALVAALSGLEERARGADLVVTGEGRIDATSFAGKVVGGVLAAGGGAVPTLCVAGQVEKGVERYWADRPGRVDVVDLTEAVGKERAEGSPSDAVFDTVMAACRRWTGDAAGAPR